MTPEASEAVPVTGPRPSPEVVKAVLGVATSVGALAFVTLVGRAIYCAQAAALGLPADQVVSAMPQSTLLVVGARFMIPVLREEQEVGTHTAEAGVRRASLSGKEVRIPLVLVGASKGACEALLHDEVHDGPRQRPASVSSQSGPSVGCRHPALASRTPLGARGQIPTWCGVSLDDPSEAAPSCVGYVGGGTRNLCYR